MFNRIKSAVGLDSAPLDRPAASRLASSKMVHKYSYNRPSFLGITEDNVNVLIDNKYRIIVSNSAKTMPLPLAAGYAECVNAGKSFLNEDMANVYSGVLKHRIGEGASKSMEYIYFGLFDGHAGYGASTDASKQLHHILHQKLVDCLDIIFMETDDWNTKMVTKDDVVIGCLEAAFNEMDVIIDEGRSQFHNPGGCTAMVVLFILDKIFIANAGDSRSVLWDTDKITQLTNDFSPYYDKKRIYEKAWENKTLLGDHFTVREFLNPPNKDDLGKSVLYKDPLMKGWTYKTLTPADLKLPLVLGEGRRSRIMNTIGVARGFGDFDLYSNHSKLPLKPLLTSAPEVTILTHNQIKSDNSLLIVGTDGLWDVMTNTTMNEICSSIYSGAMSDSDKYSTIAYKLVAAARGSKSSNTGLWTLKTDMPASLDDISVFVIPLTNYFNQIKISNSVIWNKVSIGSKHQENVQNQNTGDNNKAINSNNEDEGYKNSAAAVLDLNCEILDELAG